MRVAPIVLVLCTVFLCTSPLDIVHSIPPEDAPLSTVISGKVIDANTGAPLVDARVTLIGTDWGASTDTEGNFSIGGIPPGTYTLKASSLGYGSALAEGIEVRAEGSIQVDFALQITIIPLDEISVTATRVEKEVYYIQKAITIATGEEIQKRIPRTTPEILREETGLMIQKTTHGHGAPVVRGLMGYQVLILIDGIRLNNSTFRYGPNQYLSTIDPHLVDRIEVVRGPGSVLYGSDAQGGIVHIISKRFPHHSETFQTDALFGSTYATVDDERMGHIEIQGGEKRFGFVLAGTYRHVGDLRAGGSVGVQSPTGWKEMDGNIALSYRFAPNQTFVCAYQGVRQQDVPRYDMYPGGRYATGKESSGAYQIYLFTPQNRDLLYLDYSVRSVNDYIDVLHTTVSFHRQKEGREIQKEDDSILRTEEDDTKTLGAHLQLVSSFKMKHQLIYGLEIYRDKVGSERIDTDLETGNAEIRKGRYPDGSSFESVAFYLRDEITLRSNLIVSLGGRYNRFRLQADLDDTTFGSIDAVTHAFTGSCGVVYGLTENMNITCGLAQAFRAPNLDDETAFGDFHSGIEVPNPGLEPEQSITSEIGLKVRYSTWSGALTAYMTNLHNLIDRERSTYQGSSTLDGQYVWKKTNMNRARIQGVEANGEWSFLSEWSLYGNAAWVSGKDLSGDEPLRRIPPVMGLLGAEWKSSRGNLWAEGFIRCAGKQDKLSSEDKADVRIPPGGTPGWMTCNFRAGYRFSKFVHLIFGLENIFDEAYREHGSGLYGPGRNFIIHSEITI